ncbi:MAG TPA: c-type cytochrome [Steroidobacter sp.]
MDDSAGAEIPLSGGRRFDLGVLGTITAPNITPDPASGIGRRSDDDLVRALRYGISHSGRPLIPFMSFTELSDRDLKAIISFLRSQSPVQNAAEPDDLSWLGALAVKIVIDPERPKTRPAAEITPERSASYGRYLATAVANCRGCHTKRSKLTGAFVGRPFAGGMELEEHGSTFITPNLTTAADGVLRGLDERQFIKRFRTRAQMPTQSPMPWTEYARMTDADLGAIYLYLKSLPPTPAP